MKRAVVIMVILRSEACIGLPTVRQEPKVEGNARKIGFGGQADRPRQGSYSPGDRPLLVLRVEEGVVGVGFDKVRPIGTA
jgi:hypothetical protein